MMAALKRAGLQAHEIDYVNAHGTSTPLGDEIELRAVERLMGNRTAELTMSSTKSSIGHLLGAAGAVEAIFSILAIRDNVAPPTINLDNPSVETADRPRSAHGEEEGDQHSSVEFLWFWWHQRVADHAPLRGLTPGGQQVDDTAAIREGAGTAARQAAARRRSRACCMWTFLLCCSAPSRLLACGLLCAQRIHGTRPPRRGQGVRGRAGPVGRRRSATALEQNGIISNGRLFAADGAGHRAAQHGSRLANMNSRRAPPCRRHGADRQRQGHHLQDLDPRRASPARWRWPASMPMRC